MTIDEHTASSPLKYLLLNKLYAPSPLDAVALYTQLTSIACASPVDWAFVVLELATSLTCNLTYVETYHWYTFGQASY